VAIAACILRKKQQAFLIRKSQKSVSGIIYFTAYISLLSPLIHFVAPHLISSNLLAFLM